MPRPGEEGSEGLGRSAICAAGAKAAEQVLNAHGVPETTKDEM